MEVDASSSSWSPWGQNNSDQGCAFRETNTWGYSLTRVLSLPMAQLEMIISDKEGLTLIYITTNYRTGHSASALVRVSDPNCCWSAVGGDRLD